MGYSLPQETALGGPFTPLGFEATAQECTVGHGEIRKGLTGRHRGVGATWKRPTK
jgi:hypothetical protein